MVKIILIIMLLLPSIARSDTLDNLIENQKYLDPCTTWIYNNTDNSITYEKAKELATDILVEASNESISPFLLIGIIYTESGFKIRARSKHGAIGLMQVIPRWHRELLQRQNLYNPEVAITVGSKIFSEYIDKYKGNIRKALMAYNGNTRSYRYSNRVLKIAYLVKTFVKSNEYV